MTELTYYQDNNVRITNQSMRSGESSYRISDISWVGINPRTESSLNAKYEERIRITMIATLIVGLAYFRAEAIHQFLPEEWDVLLFCVYCSALFILIVMPVVLSLIGERKYYILLEGAFGRAEVLTSANRQYVLNIMGHINTAILEKSKIAAPWTLLPKI